MDKPGWREKDGEKLQHRIIRSREIHKIDLQSLTVLTPADSRTLESYALVL